MLCLSSVECLCCIERLTSRRWKGGGGVSVLLRHRQFFRFFRKFLANDFSIYVLYNVWLPHCGNNGNQASMLRIKANAIWANRKMNNAKEMQRQMKKILGAVRQAVAKGTIKQEKAQRYRWSRQTQNARNGCIEISWSWLHEVTVCVLWADDLLPFDCFYFVWHFLSFVHI